MTKPPKTPKPGKPGKTPSKAKTPWRAGSVGSAEDEAPRVGAGGAAGNGKNPPRRVAVVGSGVAGLSAAYLAHRNGMDVTLYESSGKCGGHALTYDSPTAGPVDLGFQVFNLTTYPHLVGLFNELGIDSDASDMSFSLSTDTVEWGSRGLGAVFAQKKNAFSADFLLMIREIVRFGKEAPEVLRESPNSRHAEFGWMTLGQYLARRGYSRFFTENYVVPMCAAIWSCSDRDTLDFPVVTLVRFWVNHHLLNLVERPLWRVVRGRSEAYVDAIVRAITREDFDGGRRGVVELDARVVAVKRKSYGVAVYWTREGGSRPGEITKCEYDDVIFACHSDQALAILGEEAKDAERAALDAIKFQKNDVWLHRDATLMPRNKKAWASWNCLKGSSRGASGEDASVCVTYWVNLLQNLPEREPDLFVTLNPPRPPATGTTQHRVTLSHPLFNARAIDAQTAINDKFQGDGGVWFAGAWLGYGFHEDGIKSAVDVLDKMIGGPGASVPWTPRRCDPRLNRTTSLALPLFKRVGASWVPPNRTFKMILPNGAEMKMRGKEIPGLPPKLAVDGGYEVPEVSVTVYDQKMFMNTVLRADIGFGEAYMNGDFDCDLYALLDMLCAGHPANVGSRAGADSGVPSAGGGIVGAFASVARWLGSKMEFAAHAALSNTREGSKRNIEYHYDAGNRFYKLWLDDTMLYSSGIHQPLKWKTRCTVFSALGDLRDDDRAGREERLKAAQYAKIDAMIDRLDVQQSDHVLEIGCGWGACAIRLCERYPNARVTGLTISNEQFAEATARVAAAGVADRVTIVLKDYRDHLGADERATYDKVISIEMIEAVGHEHLPGFFRVVSDALKPGGKAAIQVITMPDDRYESYCKSESDFIRAYIFPGGHLPSVGAMVAAAEPAGLILDPAYDDIGTHYAVTLRLWRERMMARKDDILAMGYSRKFLRMFEFYFAYCEAGFARGLIHDLQTTWVKEAYEGAARGHARARGTTHGSGEKARAIAGATLCFFGAHALATVAGARADDAARSDAMLIPTLAFGTYILNLICVAMTFVFVTSSRRRAKKRAKRRRKKRVKDYGVAGADELERRDRVGRRAGAKQSAMMRSKALAGLFADGVLNLAVGALACAHVWFEVVDARAAADADDGVCWTTALFESLLEPATPPGNCVLAAFVVALACAVALRRLLFVVTSEVGYFSSPRAAKTNWLEGAARDACVVVVSAASLRHGAFVKFIAAMATSYVTAFALSCVEFARTKCAFNDGGDAWYRRVSEPAATVTFFVATLTPRLVASRVVVPLAYRAVVVALFASVTGAVTFVTTAPYAFYEKMVLEDPSALVAALKFDVLAAEVPAPPEWACDLFLGVFAAAFALGAFASDVGDFAQRWQAKKAADAVRERVLATAAEVA